MKRIFAIICTVAIVCTSICYGQDKWLTIYKRVDGILRVITNPVANISSITYSDTPKESPDVSDESNQVGVDENTEEYGEDGSIDNTGENTENEGLSEENGENGTIDNTEEDTITNGEKNTDTEIDTDDNQSTVDEMDSNMGNEDNPGIDNNNDLGNNDDDNNDEPYDDDESDAFNTIHLTVGDEQIDVDMTQIEKCVIGHNLPTLAIVTDDDLKEIPSKNYYVTGKVSITGYGNYPDVKATAVNIKGRGNSTWGYDKKPYRLKFDKKISLCGMTKAKNYALIANYLDPSLMRNAVALKIAELLGMPYTNHCIPVNLTFNGNYRGSYMLTEKIGFNAASVNVKDESKAILFELDKNYDEPYKFTSTRYKLPVMVKDPDFDELAEADTTLTAEKRLEEWQADFTQMENGVRLKKFYDYIDISSAVDYMLVYLVTKNAELNHPKSVYMYKEKIDDKYTLGPVWDFDWAYTFSSTNKENASPTQYLLSYGSTLYGYSFFKAIVSTTEFKTAFAERWQYFKDEVWPAVQEYMAEYHDLIEVSALQNGEVWPEDKLLSYVASSEKFEEHYQNLLKFLTDRIAWIDTASNYGLYE